MKITIGILLLIIWTFSLNAFGQKTKNIESKNAKNQVECKTDLCEVMKTESEYNVIFAAPTLDDFEKYHTEDFYTTSEIPARITTRENIIGYLKNFGTRTGAVTSVATIDLNVRIYGQTAVATGIWKTTAVSEKGTQVNKFERFTRIWVKENKMWRLAASHYSPTFEIPVQR
jgi:ketosteroid isomerase-like protein